MINQNYHQNHLRCQINLIISTEYFLLFFSGQDDDNGPIVQVQVNCVFVQTEVFRLQKIF